MQKDLSAGIAVMLPRRNAMMFVRLVAVTVGPTVAMVSAILSQASSFDVFLDLSLIHI